MLVDYAKQEIEKKERIVVENENWIAIVPFWSVSVHVCLCVLLYVCSVGVHLLCVLCVCCMFIVRFVCLLCVCCVFCVFFVYMFIVCTSLHCVCLQ